MIPTTAEARALLNRAAATNCFRVGGFSVIVLSRAREDVIRDLKAAKYWRKTFLPRQNIRIQVKPPEGPAQLRWRAELFAPLPLNNRLPGKCPAVTGCQRRQLRRSFRPSVLRPAAPRAESTQSAHPSFLYVIRAKQSAGRDLRSFSYSWNA
jgi:hypothetical protein